MRAPVWSFGQTKLPRTAEFRVRPGPQLDNAARWATVAAVQPQRPKLGDRSLFPDLKAPAYLNHAGISPISAPARQAIGEMVGAYAEGGSGAISVGMELMERLRKKVGTLLTVSPSTVGFVPNTTSGVNLAALSIPWKPGDRIVLFEGEFPANITPWQQAAQLFDLDVTVLPVAPFYRDVAEGLAMVDQAVQSGVRLMAVSQVQFQTGFTMPVAALSQRVHDAGGELFVDAIQGLGIVSCEPERDGIDYLSAGGHKWLMGVQGGGLLVIRQGAAAAFEARAFGWGSHEDAFDFLFRGKGHLRYDRPFRKDASVVEGGSLALIALAALEASTDLISQLGVEEIFSHVQRYHDVLEPVLLGLGFSSLRARDAALRSGSLVVEAPSGVDELDLVARLAEAGIVAAVPDGNLRFSPHFPNSIDEIPMIEKVLKEALAAL